MRRRYLLVPALIATLSAGCFTTIGAVAGRSQKTPAGKDDPYAVGRGVLVGAIIDVALLTAFIITVDVPTFGLGSERR